MGGERTGFVHLDGWAGRAKFRVSVLAKFKKSFRVRFDEDAQYGRWRRRRGQEGLVPRKAVTFELPSWCGNEMHSHKPHINNGDCMR